MMPVDLILCNVLLLQVDMLILGAFSLFLTLKSEAWQGRGYLFILFHFLFLVGEIVKC